MYLLMFIGEVPGRDDVWKEQTIANTSEATVQRLSLNVNFLGSVDTLILQQN